MTPSSGIEPGPHWCEASALTTAPSLLPHTSAQKLVVLFFAADGQIEMGCNLTKFALFVKFFLFLFFGLFCANR